jgi:hypothetical protein
MYQADNIIEMTSTKMRKRDTIIGMLNRIRDLKRPEQIKKRWIALVVICALMYLNKKARNDDARKYKVSLYKHANSSNILGFFHTKS